jgi:very-short-patch-repair endonuclease
VRKQHGVVTRAQLLEFGFGRRAIDRRISSGRLHPVLRGVYAVGRPELTRQGVWMAAVLRCGPGAALSHESAAALWGIRPERRREVEVSVRAKRRPSVTGLVVHRRACLEADRVTRHLGIPVTTPSVTLVDLAARLRRGELEAAISEADKLDLVDPEQLRAGLAELAGWPGVAALRQTLDRRTLALTDSELERRFLPLARRAGLPKPRTRTHVNGFKVDFYWPGIGLVVETDGLRYHRTPVQQARDQRRDQAHTAAGLTTLRFTHAQVTYEPDHVELTLAAVAARLPA